MNRKDLFSAFFWRESPHGQLKVFELSTLTYGTASASFLAIRTVRRLAEDEADSFPVGSEIVLRDFYVDDLLTGASTLQEALEINEQANALLSKEGFELRKWSSNHPSLRDAEGPHSKEFNLTENRINETKALGISWNCEADIFRFDNLGLHPSLQRLTKRVVLSRIALIFDPLGWLWPSIVIACILMQEIWRSKVNWDESLPNELHTRWKHYESKLQILSSIEVPRKVIAFSDVRRIEIHGFSDASQHAYGACVYIRTTSNERHIRSHLLCSKSRVAPLKTLSIPRLELCGALMLAQLVEKVLKSLPFAPDSIYYWTDSYIVLCWLRSCSRQWTPFVANRIAEIQRFTSVKNWRHVPGSQNPAYSLSRGVMPDLLHKLKIWWNGPPWLSLDEHEWPIRDFDVPDVELPELRSVTLAAEVKAERWDLFEQFSKLHRLIRVTAFCLRFIQNCKIKKASRSRVDNIESVQSLSVNKLEEAKNVS
ncbi:PREDICTED: uncharacterized protein LOC108775755 [Cyphomyrmex costatus]|uniref:uncharacterized protein LOC108775755 n=1 Tax=Cyphomyrmex costatus TaxID=456900 RepID=UPI0008522CD9|nr:PREDICTED: uncharacterized protein LOC108775755 [Cyphomyrmex costatus]